MLENLLTNIIEKKLVIDRRMSHLIISTVITSMESKFFYLSVLGIAQSYLLPLHLNYILWCLIHLLVVERTHPNRNLYAVCHKIIYFEWLIKNRKMIYVIQCEVNPNFAFFTFISAILKLFDKKLQFSANEAFSLSRYLIRNWEERVKLVLETNFWWFFWWWF